jgi:hypothetical protein
MTRTTKDNRQHGVLDGMAGGEDPKGPGGGASNNGPTLMKCVPEPFVDADQAGTFLRLNRRRVLRLARQGKLPAYPIGDGVRRVCRCFRGQLGIR